MKRPSNVPESADWCAEDNEWVLGPKNADGDYHGEVHYWRPDGTLVSIATLVDGEPDGEARRFHENGEVSQIANYDSGVLHGVRSWFACDEPTTEKMHAPGMSKDITRSEVRYERGQAVEFRFFIAEAEVQRDGSPLIERPAGVPEGALLNPKSGNWIAGQWNGEGQKDGEMRVYRADGTLLSIEPNRADKLHGAFVQYYDDGTTPRISSLYSDGERDGAVEHFDRSGTLRRRAHLAGDTWSGPLEDFDAGGDLVRSIRVEPPRLSESVDVEQGSLAELLANRLGRRRRARRCPRPRGPRRGQEVRCIRRGPRRATGVGRARHRAAVDHRRAPRSTARRAGRPRRRRCSRSRRRDDRRRWSR